MPYRVEIKPQAEKVLLKIPNPYRRRIANTIDSLAQTPGPAGCVKLSGTENAYRIRIGDYRVVYEIVDKVLIVYVARVAHRKDGYRDL